MGSEKVIMRQKQMDRVDKSSIFQEKVFCEFPLENLHSVLFSDLSKMDERATRMDERSKLLEVEKEEKVLKIFVKGLPVRDSLSRFIYS